MDFTIVAEKTGTAALKTVKYILALNISPEAKRTQLARLFRLTGEEFYQQLFAMNSEIFDSTALKTLGFTNPDDQVERLAAKVVQDDNLGRNIQTLTGEFYYSVLSDSQHEAFENAKALDRHPVLTRIAGAGCCEWCQKMAGTYTDPSGDCFAHHENCNCKFQVSGYATRNGTYTGGVHQKKGA